MKIFFYSLILCLAFQRAEANGPSCTRLFAAPAASKQSAVRVKDSAWTRLHNVFEKKSKGQKNPFIDAAMNADKTGLVHRDFRTVITNYDDLIKTIQLPEVSYKEYEKLTKELAPTLLNLAKNKKPSINQVFAALEATRIMSVIEAKTIFPLKEQAEQKKKEEEQKKKDEEEKKDDDFKWHEENKKYKPENKDLASGGKGKKPVIILKTNSPLENVLFKTISFDVINYKEMSSNPLIRPKRLAQSKSQEKHFTTLGVFGASEISIPVQYGFEPVVGAYKGFKIVERTTDDFFVEISDSNLKSVSFPLKKKDSQRFNTSIGSSVYSSPTGIPKNQWPKDIQYFVSMNKGKSPLEVAKNLEAFLSLEGGYIYFSKGDLMKEADLTRVTAELESLKTQYPVPVAMAMVKSFNCDGAAWIGAAILKDFFKIPTRTVGGRTSAGMSVEKDGTSLSVIRSTDPKHMWLEVWDGSNWVPFDMTPKLNNPDGQSGKSDLKQHERKDVDQNAPQKDSGDSKKSESESKDSSEKKSEKKSEAQESKEQEAKAQKEDKDGKDNKDNKDTEVLDTKEMTQVENLQSKNKTELQRKYLVYKVFEILKAWSSEMLLMDASRKTIKENVFDVMDKLSHESFERHQKDALAWFRAKESDIFDRKDETLSQWISSVKLLSSQGHLRESYLELKAMEFLIKSISENRNLSKKEEEFLISIQDVLRGFRKVRHKDSVQYDLAERIYRKLPGTVSKQFLREKYGEEVMDIESLALKNFASDLQDGKLQALVRSALLRDFVDMVLSSDRILRYKDEKTLFRSISPKSSQDLVVARSPLEIQKMLLNPRAGEHIFSKLVRGEQFSMGARETIRVPDPRKPIERKVSILYYDISGSMNGDKMLIQDSFLMTYTDRALTDVDFAGNPLHEVYIFPFGDNVHVNSGVHIKSVEDAKRFIAKMINYNSAANDGTNIENALLHFYGLVAQANSQNIKDKKSPLKKANLVLVTDGGSQINLEKVLNERKKVPAEVQVNMNFLAVGETNEVLESLAKSSNMSTTKPMYRHVDSGLIASIVKESQRPPVDKDAFAQSKDMKVPVEITRLLNQLTDKAANFKIEVDIQDVQRKLSELRIADLKKEDISNFKAPSELFMLQETLVKLDLPRNVKARIVYSLIFAYEEYSGRRLDRVLVREKEAFEALYEWARK